VQLRTIRLYTVQQLPAGTQRCVRTPPGSRHAIIVPTLRKPTPAKLGQQHCWRVNLNSRREVPHCAGHPVDTLLGLSQEDQADQGTAADTQPGTS
jgi:hypothetical protein